MIKVMLISIALYIYFFLIKNIQDRLKNTDKQYDVAIVYLFSLLHPKMKMLSLITFPMSFQTCKSFVRLQNTI